jgi:acyl-homoserine-lactone acylase
MGAALPGLPVVNIGFNQQLAWTHTVDTAAHFTLYRLELDPKDSRRYLLDGQSLALQKTTLKVQVREANGQLSSVSRDLYESRFGPLLRLPGMLEWTASEAFALRDANLQNTRVLQQWYAINKARDVSGLQASVEKIQGIPWVNTLATDAAGNALYMDQSVVPYLRPQQLAECVIPQLAEQGLPGLHGNRSACEWTVDASTAQPGITPAAQLPVLRRQDFVQNSNDSAWLTNPASPLSGFSPLVSRERPLSPRAQFALGRLQGNAPVTPAFLRAMVTDNHVTMADRLLPDLLTLCGTYAADAAIKPACIALAGWDRSASSSASIGLLYFQAFFHAFSDMDGAWRQPFNPEQPLTTPNGLALDNPKIAEQLRLALVEASQTVAKSGVSAGATWGQVQWLQRGEQRIAIPGGDGHLGVYNAMQSEQRGAHREVVSGSSYIQLVTFTAKGPQAHGLLAFSQSTEPGSKHYADQTRLFSQQQWPVLPFSEAEIKADGVVEQLELKE